MDLDLRGRKVIITGATRGIGRAILAGFLKEGAQVSFCARNAAAVAETAASLGGEGMAVDVSSKPDLKSFVEQAARAMGGLDCLVVNASAMADGADEAAFRAAFETDMLQAVVAAEAAMPWLETSDNGSITAISSISASEDYRHGDAAYGAMKAALNFYIKSLAGNVAPKQIRANCVSPGTTWFEGGFWHEAESRNPEGFKAAMARNPMGRMASPEDIADAVLFLASNRARFITGINLVVDGGYTRRVQN